MAEKKLKPGRYGCREENGKLFLLTDAMIERRHGLARGLGYLLRRHAGGKPPFMCWEKKPTHKLKDGTMVSPVHIVYELKGPRSGHPDGVVELTWPEEIEAAAWAIDKGKPLPSDPKDETEPVDAGARTLSLFKDGV